MPNLATEQTKSDFPEKCNRYLFYSEEHYEFCLHKMVNNIDLCLRQFVNTDCFRENITEI